MEQRQEILNILTNNQRLYNENQRLYNENMHSYNNNIELFNKMLNDLIIISEITRQTDTTPGQQQETRQQETRQQEPSFFSDIISSSPLPIRPIRHNNRLNRHITRDWDSRYSTASNTENDTRTMITNFLNQGSRRNELIESSIILFDISLSDLFPTNNYGLTQEQLNAELEMIQYKTDVFREHRCPISLEDFIENEEIVKIKKCSHIFKKRNIMRWFQTNSVCPMCRCNLVE